MKSGMAVEELEQIALESEILGDKVEAEATANADSGSKAAGKSGRRATPDQAREDGAKSDDGSPSKRSPRPVIVEIGGQEYRIRSAASEAWLRKVAACVDDAMGQIRERTDTVDSLDVALLAALNLARQVVQLREAQLDGLGEPSEGELAVDRGHLRDLIERVETVLEEGPPAARGEAPLHP